MSRNKIGRFVDEARPVQLEQREGRGAQVRLERPGRRHQQDLGGFGEEFRFFVCLAQKVSVVEGF